MRKRLTLLCACVLVLNTSIVFASGPFDDEYDGWSWTDGLLGNGSHRGDVFTDSDEIYPGLLCDECRDPDVHPMDFVAVAYNSFFGEEAWMWDSQLGIPFRIYNLEGQWVVVWFEGMVFDSITLLPDTLNVRLRLPNGQILTFTVLQDGPNLPVGEPDPSPPTADSCSCGGDGDGEEGDDDYFETDVGLPEPPETDEPSGVVSIVDPDEDDRFPEWDL